MRPGVTDLGEGPGVGDYGGDAVEHGFEGGDTEGLVEGGEGEEGGLAEEGFELGGRERGWLWRGGRGLRLRVEDRGRRWGLRCGVRHVGMVWRTMAEGFEELRAAFAGELGAYEEDAGGGVVLGWVGLGEGGEVDAGAYVEDAVIRGRGSRG